MIIGIVGFIVMLCVMVLEDVGVCLQDGEIVVMGVSGGVGSIVVVLLYKLGYQVVVVFGCESIYEYLKSLGVSCVFFCDEFVEFCFLEK